MMVGGEQYLPNGNFVRTEVIDPLPYAPPSDTHDHEILHALADEEAVVEISGVPSGDSLGHTRFSHFSAKGAAASLAFHKRGRRWDEMILRMSGVNISVAEAAARASIAGKDKERKVAAGYLAAEGTISGWQFRNALSKIRRGDDVMINMTTPDGKQESEVVKGVKEETVMIPGRLYDLPPINPPGKKWSH